MVALFIYSSQFIHCNEQKNEQTNEQTNKLTNELPHKQMKEKLTKEQTNIWTHTVWKSRNMITGQNRSTIFWYVVLIV